MRAFVSILVGSLVLMPAVAHSKNLSNDDQIREALIGSTISGVEDGKSYVEFLQPDGRIDGDGREGRYSGHWQIAKGQICFSYDEDGKANSWDCVKVGIEGARIVWIDKGERSYAKLIAGNPYGF
jgi:hypothetical protein